METFEVDEAFSKGNILALSDFKLNLDRKFRCLTKKSNSPETRSKEAKSPEYGSVMVDNFSFGGQEITL
jgi:hypothetical protein